MRVGIPRAMSYYYFQPFFAGMLRSLGAEMLVSPPTTPAILAGIDACPTDEPCLAVKLCFAHTRKLAEAGPDFYLLPSLVSVERSSYCCPKFIGLPDMVRHALDLPPDRVLRPVVDLRGGGLRRAAAALAPLGPPAALERALRCGARRQARFHALTARGGLTTVEAIAWLENGRRGIPRPRPGRNAVIGHPYVIHELVAHGLPDWMRGQGGLVTAEMVDPGAARAELAGVAGAEGLWNLEARLLGAAFHLLRRRLVDRMVVCQCFECGPASIIETFIEDEAERSGIPLLLLALDEHTGEAGLRTRIEAFLDTRPGAPAVRSHPPARRPARRVATPGGGNLDFVARKALEHLGVTCVPTPPTGPEVIARGREAAPEFACFPLVVTLGQMRHCLEAGADTILTVGGKGRCRLGWYADVQASLLRRLGYDFQMVTVDTPFPLRSNAAAFGAALEQVLGRPPAWGRVLAAFHFAYRVFRLLDEVEQVCLRLRARERRRGEADAVRRDLAQAVEQATTLGELARAAREFRRRAAAIEVEDTDPLRVRIVGEIWAVLDHPGNLHLERLLAAHPGRRVEVDRELSGSSWLREHVLHDPRLAPRVARIARAASRYLSEPVGGHGRESVGLAALAPGEGVDGVIHVFPFTCMPEIVAQNLLVRVSRDLDLPVLTCIVSEQTGEAGFRTRLEAFLDVLEERRANGVRPRPLERRG